MTDIELVIKISEEQYSLIMQSHRRGVERYISKEAMMHAIKNGTPLPKGHGRLIDASNLLTVTDYDSENEKTYVLYDEIDNALTIIEADKAESEAEE